jgi:hypothetical protein
LLDFETNKKKEIKNCNPAIGGHKPACEMGSAVKMRPNDRSAVKMRTNAMKRMKKLNL